MVFSVVHVAKEQEAFIRETLQQVERELHPSVAEDEEIIRRALFAVRNQGVLFHRYISVFSILTASVRDVRVAEVTIDFRNDSITCSCPQEGWCRHKVSVLLSLYQYIDSVQEWASHWRAKKTIDLQSLAMERTPENWLKMADEVINYYFQGNIEIPVFLYKNLAENVLVKLKKQTPFEREWQPVYQLFMELAVLHKLSLRYFERDSVDQELYDNFIDERFHSIKTIAHKIHGTSRLFSTDPFFDKMQAILREFVFGQEGHVSRRMNLYLLFWDEVFTEKRRALEELVFLQEQKELKIPEAVNVFYIILKNYSALEENMHRLRPDHLELYLGLAKFAYSKNDRRAAEILLKPLLPHLHAFILKVHPAFRYHLVSSVYSLYEKISLTEEEEILLYSSFGKDGVHLFSKYLLNQKRYEEWSALQQMYPSSISYLEHCGLKEVAEEAPAAALPLYHFYAMEEIKQKSRNNYKEAVRIWKKMKSAAKKAGKINFWNDYITSIREQYKRLRALQEELEKGNLYL